MSSARLKTVEPNFKFEILVDAPSDSAPYYYFPKGPSGVNRDGAIIKFESKEGEPWTGVFAFGEGVAEDQRVVFVGPDKNHLVVVVRGAGYVVCVANRTAVSVEADPVFDVFFAESQELILFHDFTKVVAYGAHGMVWKSERLSWDGIQDAVLVGDTLQGKAWDAPNEKWVEFSVDVETGSKHGGAAPPS